MTNTYFGAEKEVQEPHVMILDKAREHDRVRHDMMQWGWYCVAHVALLNCKNHLNPCLIIRDIKFKILNFPTKISLTTKMRIDDNQGK